MAEPLPREFNLIVSTETGTTGPGPQFICWSFNRKFRTLLDRTLNVTFPVSVGSVAEPTWTYFALDAPEYVPGFAAATATAGRDAASMRARKTVRRMNASLGCAPRDDINHSSVFWLGGQRSAPETLAATSVGLTAPWPAGGIAACVALR